MVVFLLLGAIVNVAVAWISLLNGSWGELIAQEDAPFPSEHSGIERYAAGWPALSLQHNVERGWYDEHRGGFLDKREHISIRRQSGFPSASSSMARLRDQHAVLYGDPLAALRCVVRAAAPIAHQARLVSRMCISGSRERSLHRVRPASAVSFNVTRRCVGTEGNPTTTRASCVAAPIRVLQASVTGNVGARVPPADEFIQTCDLPR
jgi:hypothetical protein